MTHNSKTHYHLIKENNFSLVNNGTATDHSLTHAALGLLIEVLSHNDGWIVYKDVLLQREGTSNYMLDKLHKELRRKGYADLYIRRMKHNKLKGSFYVFYETLSLREDTRIKMAKEGHILIPLK